MKFAWKIFFVSFLIIIISFGTGGFVLIHSVFTTSINSKIQNTCENNGYITASLYAIESNAEIMGYGDTYYNYIAKSFSEQMSNGNSDTKVKIGTLNEMSAFDDVSFIAELDVNSRTHRIVDDNGKKYIHAVSRIFLTERDFYVETLTNISDVYQNRGYYCQTYQIILMCVALFASMVLVFVSRYITRPLVKLSNAARQIAQGDFSRRVDVSSTKEVYELSESFNTMAQYIENYIEELKKSAQSRDDFVADFTHELKTPLTSVIGYADMLRSYDLDANRRREFADYIFKEGKRLEALSVNLLNIIVLKNNNVEMKPITTEFLFLEVKNSTLFLLKKYCMKLEAHFESADIYVEPSLIKTLLFNLIDNACKASAKGDEIQLYGYTENNRYQFEIIDSGYGIPKDELEKIIQPFYMVDKSRSRRMGGAGLGLSLCNEIARIHGSELIIESVLNKGTTVSFSVMSYNEMEGEQIEE